MFRIDSANFLPNGNGTGKNAFTAGNPSVPTGPTVLHPDWLNNVQEEIVNIIEAQGIPLSKTIKSQLKQSVWSPIDVIRKMVLSSWRKPRSLTAGGSPVGGGFTDIVWIPSLTKFIGVNSNASGQRSAVSRDGIVWDNTTNIANSASTWFGVAYCTGIALAVAVGGGNLISSSPDGVTWTPRTGPASGGSWRSIAANATRFVAIAPSGTVRFMTSTDGINWSGQTPAIQTGSWDKIVWSQALGLFVIAGSNAGSGSGNFIATSPDGVTWTARTTPLLGTFNTMRLTYDAQRGIFVAMAQPLSGNTIQGMYSYDAVNWNAFTYTAPRSVSGIGAICYCGDLGAFVFSSGDGLGNSYIYYTTDFVTWSDLYIDQTSNAFTNVMLYVPELARIIAAGTSLTSTNLGPLGDNGGDFSSSAAAGSVTTWTTAVGKNVLGPFLLPSGEWEINAGIAWSAAAITGTAAIASISTTSATVEAVATEGRTDTDRVPTAAAPLVLNCRRQIILSLPTNIYLVGQMTFSAGTPVAGGWMRAKRIA